ncbi:MAG TPA: carboxypeptidase regulatory-like domain-containing protein [Verrucomicrobiae bacterium]|nr:carboxypeptidase regulatory-like domain-containing protein [Verrucomicrobiae bacterium]
MNIQRFSRLLSCALFYFLTAKASAFVFYPVGSNILRWNVDSPLLRPSSVNPTNKAIRYFIASDAYSEANRTNEVNAVRACFDQWQSVAGTNLRFEFAGFISPAGLDSRYDHTNVVFWAKKSVLVNAGTENLSGRRAWTSITYATDGSILDADIVLNGVQYQWFTDANDTVNQAQFVESILLHEVGHFLGLDHTPAGGATVIDGGNGINTNSGLSADETAAARFFFATGAVTRAAIQGTVRLNGAGILGAVVIAEDAAGNIAGATVTQSNGSYHLFSLPPGGYKLRVTPLDPSNSGNSSLLRGAEIAADYTQAITSFLPTTNLPLTLVSAQVRVQDVNVTPGIPPFRITSMSKPTTQADLVTVVRYAISITQGQSNLYVGVSSPNLSNGAILSVTGDGVTVGATTFYRDRVAVGLNSLVAPISVSSNASPGLRTLVASQNGNLAYANGYLEIASPIPDYNFDALDDRFQRKYWPMWTTSEASPTADPDKDGFSNSLEYRTGTNPTNALSNRLFLNNPARGRFGPQLSWPSDEGKTYQIYSKSTLAGAAWQPFGQPVTAQGEIWSVPLVYENSFRFFRLELRR